MLDNNHSSTVIKLDSCYEDLIELLPEKLLIVNENLDDTFSEMCTF